MNRFKSWIRQDKKSFQNLPWYFVLGPRECGIKSALANFGLDFVQVKHFGEEAESIVSQFSEYDWWFSEKAVFIDIKSQEPSIWKQMIKLLKDKRKSKPLSGVLLFFPLVDFAISSSQERHEFMQTLLRKVYEIHTTFRVAVPVYCLLTKVDLIKGFSEFFNHINQEEIRQVFGMTFPKEVGDSLTLITKNYHEQFSSIIDTLRSQVLWGLEAESMIRARALIHAFPEQLQLFRQPIETLLSDLLSSIQYPKALLLRGIYFCSSVQKGEPHDFVLETVSKEFQFIPEEIHIRDEKDKHYFLKRLFLDILLPESKILGESESYQRIRKISYKTAFIALPLLMVFCFITLRDGYQDNIVRIEKVKNALVQFNQSTPMLRKTKDQFSDLLPQLQALNHAKTIYNHLPLSVHSLFVSYMIGAHTKAGLSRFLSHVFIPKVAAQIEANLNQNISDQNLLYATLKAYLAFSLRCNLHSDVIRSPMEYTWEHEFLGDPTQKDELREYLNLALQFPIPKLPLDEELINRVREQLEAIVPSQRAYGLLQLSAAVSDFPSLLLASVIGDHFYEIFISTNKLVIPALYTRAGFYSIFLSHYQSIAEEVSKDNTDIGLSHHDYEIETVPQIVSRMQDRYQNQYQDHWTKTLNSLHIKAVKDLKHAIEQTHLFTATDSPFDKLLLIVYNNTHTIVTDTLSTPKYFYDLNQFKTGNTASSWQNVQKVLMRLEDYLRQIQSSADINQSEYNAVLSTIRTGKSPIIDLALVANECPDPIKRWLNEFSHGIWDVLIAGAHTYVNTLWQDDVLPAYNARIRGRYPIAAHAISEVEINDFNQFFATNGILNQFFIHYLKPFVKSDSKIWQLYAIQGYDFQMAPRNIASFQRALLIRQNYFLNGADRARVSFSVKPLVLDAHVSHASFVIGGTTIHYSHGPQNRIPITWPFVVDRQDSRISLSTFANEQYTKWAGGPWSIFKLFDHGEFKQTQIGSYIFSSVIYDHFISFQIQGTADKGVFELKYLKGFYLPNDIAS